ncbi:hypothetical protein Tco_1351314, partial [Tanacetum coccineum]
GSKPFFCSWDVLAVSVQSPQGNPSLSLALHISQPLMGIGLSDFQVGMGYKGNGEVGMVRGLAVNVLGRWYGLETVGERWIGPSKSSQSLSNAHKWAVEID